jgi:hypothetical protein
MHAEWKCWNRICTPHLQIRKKNDAVHKSRIHSTWDQASGASVAAAAGATAGGVEWGTPCVASIMLIALTVDGWCVLLPVLFLFLVSQALNKNKIRNCWCFLRHI